MFGRKRTSAALGQRKSYNREWGFCLVYFNPSRKELQPCLCGFNNPGRQDGRTLQDFPLMNELFITIQPTLENIHIKFKMSNLLCVFLNQVLDKENQ